MAMNGFTKDMNIIQKLNDEPNDRDGLTAGELKAKFDEGGLAVKDYLNNTVKPHVDGMEEAADAHAADKANPHEVTKTQVGLGNVPNVSTNNQTPTYTEAASLTRLTSGEKLGTALGKLAKAVSSLISHIGDGNIHFTAAERTKLSGIATGAEVNQNAFSNVKVGSATVAADAKTDTLELTAGNNITLTADAANDRVTIAAKDTTYSSKAAASGGTAVSLVTTGEKYNWNSKANGSHTHTIDTVTDLVTATAYGPAELVSFQDAHGGLPLKSCIVGIEPAQSGSGDPSPTNVRPISGWDHVQVVHAGRNLLYNGLQTTEDGKITVNPDGTITLNASSNIGNVSAGVIGFMTAQTDYRKWLPTGTYRAILNADSSDAVMQICYYSEDQALVILASGVNFTFTVTDAMKYVLVRIRVYNSTGSFTCSPAVYRTDDTGTAFQPFSGAVYDYAFPAAAKPVYGGTLDLLNGTLTVERAIITLSASMNWVKSTAEVSGGRSIFYIRYGIADCMSSGGDGNPNGVTMQCSHYEIGQTSYGSLRNKADAFAMGIGISSGNTDIGILIQDSLTSGTAAGLGTWLAQQAEAGTPVQVCYPLAEPVEYQLTPELVAALAGQNNFWADCGDVTVEYGAFLQALEGAVENHVHDAEYIVSGILPVDRGGTGNSTGYVTAGQKSGTTLGTNATAEGHNVTASGAASHAEGEETVASAKCAHAEGTGTIASAENQHVFGKYNVSNDRAAEIVGWGTHTYDRKDIRSMNTAGDMWIAGTLTQASDARLKDVQGEVPDVSGIRAVRFRWNDVNGEHDEKDHIGYIAQDVEKLAPFLVGDDSNGYKSLDYIALLCAKVEWLERKVKALQAAAETEGGN